MWSKSSLMILCLLLLGPAWLACAGVDPALMGWWKLDDGSGTVAVDSSGQSSNGTLFGNPVWSKQGMIGGCLTFDGTNDDVVVNGSWQFAQYTLAMWFRIDSGAGSQRDLLSWCTEVPLHGALLEIGTNETMRYLHRAPLGNSGGPSIYSTAGYTDRTWHHVAAVKSATDMILYIDGVQVATQSNNTQFDGPVTRLYLGTLGSGSRWLPGALDDVQMYNRALAAAEIQKIMLGLSDKSFAENVSPLDGATDVPRDATLSWTAGRYPATHDVYFGTTFADVNTASRTSAKGLLVSQGQTTTTFDPAGLFAYGQTYYWRIDEVNQAPDKTIYKGSVWSFTAEPYGYPVKPLAAKASSAQAGMGPEKTIDGSGLNTSDLHGTTSTTMWLSAGAQPNWIQYEFDKVYKLHQLLVWNSNQEIEVMLGFGARKVTIETSVDGTKWTPLANVPEFARAPGAPDYAANTTVNFSGIEARFVKLTINTTWGGLAPQTGLAEVRFTCVPVQARAPQPATAATGVAADARLDWRPGRLAASHTVYFGTDPNAVAKGTVAAKIVADHGFAPGSLNFGTTYYWKVDEVNTVTYPGDVWSFTTQEFAAIDDFESYTDKAGAEVFSAWIDGVTDGLSNSVVGLATAAKGTFCDTTIFHGGKASMPFEYNNVKAPFYSQAERTFDKAQDWTGNGATHLDLWVRGMPVSFLQAANGDITTSAQGADIYNTTDEFRYIYKQLTGDGSITLRVDRLDLTNAWVKAGVMIRETLQPSVKSVHTIVSGSNGFEFQYRPTAGANTVQGNTTGGTPPLPQWVRLTRKGNTFTGEYSSDGKTWNKVVSTAINDPQDLLMNNTVYIGIAVTSHVANVTTVAQFSNITTTGNVTGAWQVADIGVAHGGNGPGDLYLTVKDSAGKAATVSYPGGANVNGWTQWKIPLSDLTAAGVKTTSIKKMAISVGDPAKPTAGGAGTINIDDIGYGHPVK